LGLGIAAPLVAAMALGWLVDSLADTFPVFVLAGLGLGIVAACAYAVIEFRKLLADTDRDTE
jgi:F0F1-type ATP synthase assembly protein I